MQFEPNLEHQREAIAAISRLFEGAPYTRPEERLWNGDVSANVLRLSPEEWLANAKAIASENGIDDPAASLDHDFTIEMETGTGKTYVYLRTVFELHRRYGLHKFIIIVPSVAIREGVLATIRDTKPHFHEIYATEATVVEYDSKKMPAVQSFCVTNTLSIMVMNKQAFDSDNKVINDESRDNGNLMEALRTVRPIIIMDEPQEGMDTDNMKKRLAAFNPLCKLRYSATHREPKNIVYRLTPYDAYNRGLVKKIAVLSIHETNTQSNVAIAFRKLNLSSKDPTAQLELNTRLKGGDFKTKTITVKRRDDLEEKTGNPVYHGWIVDDIGTTDLYDGEGYIRFTNGEKLVLGGANGEDKETIFRQQIRRTLQTHFECKKRLLPMGIKPLSLFFIDRVAHYTEQDGLIRRLFVEEYEAIYPRYNGGNTASNTAAVHGGYFAKVKGEYTDNKTSMASNAEIYDKILRDKETLLSMDEPLEFIFSHSALGVGWDNPNVFTICTLNESESQIKKRQEIGRGLRLCVEGKSGKRYRDPENTPEGQEVNLLTVVANQSYYAFSKSYQDELLEEMGKGSKAPPTRNLNKPKITIRRNDARFSSDDFTALWANIAQKTKCRVHFREDELIEQSLEALATIAVECNRLEIALTYVTRMSEEDGIEATAKGSARAELNGTFARIDAVGELSRNTSISQNAARTILARLPAVQKRQLATNPMQFLSEAAKKVKHVMNRELVRLVQYEPTGEAHPLTLFDAEVETTGNTTATPKRGLYDRMIHDSDIEKNFAGDLDNHHAVRVFVKLPKTYKIPTPIGSYNPDFALVIEKRDLDNPEAQHRFFFTVETKGTAEWEKLKPDERMKIECAVKHFEAIGLKSYLAPVDSLKTFDTRALERVGQTFLT